MSQPTDFERDRIKIVARERGSTPFYEGEERRERKYVLRLHGGQKDFFSDLSPSNRAWLAYAEKSLKNGQRPLYPSDHAFRMEINNYGGIEGFLGCYERHLEKIRSLNEKPKAHKKKHLDSYVFKKGNKNRESLRKSVIDKYRSDGIYAIDEIELPNWLSEEISRAGGVLKWVPFHRKRLRLGKHDL